VNRPVKALYNYGYRRIGPTTRSPGTMYQDPAGNQLRIMLSPTRGPFSGESDEKRVGNYYYRYKPVNGSWGRHIGIPNK
jgi:hypothetical protein